MLEGIHYLREIPLQTKVLLANHFPYRKRKSCCVTSVRDSCSILQVGRKRNQVCQRAVHQMLLPFLKDPPFKNKKPGLEERKSLQIPCFSNVSWPFKPEQQGTISPGTLWMTLIVTEPMSCFHPALPLTAQILSRSCCSWAMFSNHLWHISLSKLKGSHLSLLDVIWRKWGIRNSS